MAAMRIFLDIGAHQGALSLQAVSSGFYDRVYAFEPIAQPTVPLAGIEWHHAAVSNHFGGDPFYVGRHNGGWVNTGSSLFADKLTGDLEGQTTVSCLRLATWMRQLDATEIDLHLDAEGAEYLILPDLFVTSMIDRITRLSVEWHGEKIPSIKPAFDSALRSLVDGLGLPTCLVREEPCA